MNPLGLHTRPAAKLVAAARAYDAEVRIAGNGRRVDGKSIVSLLTLAAARGVEIELQACGHDAAAALAELGAIVDSGFDEREGA